MNHLESLKTEALKSLGFSSDDYFRLAKKFTPEKLAYYMQLAFAVGFDAGMKEERDKHGNNLSKAIKQFDEKGNEIAIFDSCAEASRSVHRSSGRISDALKKGYKCAGFYWKYA